jgi:hypothetical protein
MAFLIYTIFILVCLISFLMFIFIGRESWLTYFIIISSMVGYMFGIAEIIILVGKVLLS